MSQCLSSEARITPVPKAVLAENPSVKLPVGTAPRHTLLDAVASTVLLVGSILTFLTQ